MVVVKNPFAKSGHAVSINDGEANSLVVHCVKCNDQRQYIMYVLHISPVLRAAPVAGLVMSLLYCVSAFVGGFHT